MVQMQIKLWDISHCAHNSWRLFYGLHSLAACFLRCSTTVDIKYKKNKFMVFATELDFFPSSDDTNVYQNNLVKLVLFFSE